VSTDQVHLDAWADCGDGYTVQLRQAVLRCVWCDYVAIADTKREAVAIYQRDHEQPIIERDNRGLVPQERDPEDGPAA
jgi:hypothetical protein